MGSVAIVPTWTRNNGLDFLRIFLMALGLAVLRVALVGQTRESFRVITRHSLPPGQITLLDVRASEDYRRSHLLGAYSVEDRAFQLGQFSNTRQHPTLVVYDQPGRLARAREVALSLHRTRRDTILILADADLGPW